MSEYSDRAYAYHAALRGKINLAHLMSYLYVDDVIRKLRAELEVERPKPKLPEPRIPQSYITKGF